MGVEDTPGHVQEFFYKKLQRRPGQPMAEWVNVFERAVLHMTAEGLNVELKNMGLASLREEQFDPRATAACVRGR